MILSMPAPLPFITVALPTYKRVDFLKQSLESAFSQDYPSFEIIVHDDAQDDSIRAIVESFASDRIRYRQNRPPLGLLPKLNDFLSLAKGEWLVILCDDDVLEPGYLSAIGALATAHPEASLIHTRFKVIDQTGKVIREDLPCPVEMSPFKFASRILDSQKMLFTWNITGIAFRPKTLAALGGFTPFHRGMHTDILAWFKLGSTAPSFCDERALCSIRRHSGSITMGEDPDFEATFETNLRMRREVLSVIDGLEANAETPDEQKLVKECRRVFKYYFSYPLTAYDLAFEHALLNERLPMKKFCRVFSVMRTLNIPFYPRIAVYLLLVSLPLSIRKKITSSFIRHRKKKIAVYYDRFGLQV